MDNEERSGSEEPVAPGALPGQEKLKGSWQLLKEACVEYRARFATSLAIFSVPITLSILLSGLSYATMFPPFAYMPLLSGVKVVLSFLSLFAGILAGFALLLSIRDGYGARESLVQAIRNSIPYLFVSFLVFSSFIGGLFLFFVPGLLFLIWFSFSFFAFVFEGKRGMDALLRSKQLFSGNFWRVAGRMSFLAIILLILTIPLAIFGQYVGHWGNLVLEVFTLLLVPVMLLYSLFLFRDLVRVQENATPAVSKISFRVFVWLCVLLGTPFIVGMIAFRSMLLVTHDIPEPDDSDLQLPILNIPREENAYYVFSEAKDMELGSSEVSTFLDGSEWDDERVQDILQKNQNVLDIFERGVRLHIFQQPEMQDPDRYDAKLQIEPIGYLRSMANVSLLKAQYFFRNGMESDAFKQALKTIKMGQMIEDAQGSTISYLFGMAIKNKGLDSIRLFLDSTNSSSEELLRYSRDLSGFRESKRALVKALKAEYIFDTQSLDREIVPVLRGERSVSINMNGSPEVRFGLSGEHFSLMKKRGSAIFYYFQPNEMKRLSQRFLRAQLDGADEDFLALDNSRLEKQKMREEFVLDSTWMKEFRRNSFGRVLVLLQILSEGNLNVKRVEEKFSVKATQVLLALKAFEQDRGMLPNSLEELVEELVTAYLPEVPQDPFDGKPMRYDTERRILYSTGEDLIDDGGDIDEENWQGGKDLGFTITRSAHASPKLFNANPREVENDHIRVSYDVDVAIVVNKLEKIQFQASVSPRHSSEEYNELFVYRVDDSLKIVGLPLCRLEDNGDLLYGDSTYQDGVFSCFISFLEKEEGKVKLVVQVGKDGRQVFLSPEISIDVIKLLTLEEQQIIETTQNQSWQVWEASKAQLGDTVEARNKTVEATKNMPGVADAGVSDDGTIWIEYESGASGALLLNLEGTL